MSSRVAVLGAGTMGAGIAQACAGAGHEVLLYDISEEARQRGLDAISSSLKRFVSRERMSQDDADALLERVSPSASLADIGAAAVVIEAVPEDLGIKKKVWQEAAAAAAKA